jgi:SAM-dependent methyltransferase
MGVSYHGIHFLSYVKEKYGNFGFSVTFGRQGLHLDQKTRKKFGIFNSRFLDEVSATILNSKTMDSIDFSGYEGANILHDLNLPVKENLIEQFDSLIDFGTTEHVFNVPQVLDNCVKLVKKGGKIIHILPSNNFNGHGLYQFSPELFYSYYSESNGFHTEIFLAETNELKYWMRLSKPSNGNRLEINRCSPLFIMVLAIKQHNIENKSVQQSDYEFIWGKDSSADLERAHLFFSFKLFFRKMIIKILRFIGLYNMLKLVLKCYSTAGFERYYFNKNIPS